MTQDKFTIAGDQLTGRGLTFDISVVKDRGDRLVEMSETIYLQGRESAMLSREERFDVQFAVEALRALAVIVGPGLPGERHCRAAAALARLLHEQASTV